MSSSPNYTNKSTKATLFLPSNEKELIRLRDFPGVEGISLDFGIEERDVPAQREAFPPELLFLLGKLGISLAFTLYPSQNA